MIGLENSLIDLTGQFEKIDQEALDSGLGACEAIAAGLRQTWTESLQMQSQEPVQLSGQTFG